MEDRENKDSTFVNRDRLRGVPKRHKPKPIGDQGGEKDRAASHLIKLRMVDKGRKSMKRRKENKSHSSSKGSRKGRQETKQQSTVTRKEQSFPKENVKLSNSRDKKESKKMTSYRHYTPLKGQEKDMRKTGSAKW